MSAPAGRADRLAGPDPTASRLVLLSLPREVMLAKTQRWYTTNDVRWARVSYRECRGVVFLGEPVDAGGAEPVGECVDSFDELVCDVLAAPRLAT